MPFRIIGQLQAAPLEQYVTTGRSEDHSTAPDFRQRFSAYGTTYPKRRLAVEPFRQKGSELLSDVIDNQDREREIARQAPQNTN